MNQRLSPLVLALTLSLAVGIRPADMAAQNQPQASTRQITRKVMPDYPEIAKRMNLTGKVKLRLVVAADGHVKAAQVLGGHPVLVQSAEKAVKEWKFSPDAGESRQVVEMEFAGTEVR